MDKYFVYILYSQSKNRYYIGSSANVLARLERHNAGATPSTKPGRPWIVVYTESFSTKTEALQRESHIKKQKSRKFIESLFHSSAG